MLAPEEIFRESLRVFYHKVSMIKEELKKKEKKLEKKVFQ
jgi:hypothetical protein